MYVKLPATAVGDHYNLGYVCTHKFTYIHVTRAVNVIIIQ